MIDLTAKYPVPPHKTWDIQDASKLQEYMTCPRKYFYRYVLGWTTEGVNHDLVFGEAVHRTMEVLYDAKKQDVELSTPVKTAARAAFMNHYREYFAEHTDQDKSPKDPGNVTIMLDQYIKKYAHEDIKVEHIEVAGSVPLDTTGEMSLHFRIDTIVEQEGKKLVLEHKTGKQNSRQWRDQWLLKMQVGVYTHALYCVYPTDDVYGVVINGLLFKKGGNELLRIPVRKTPDSMNVWLWNTLDLMVRLKKEFLRLSHCSPADRVMEAFPMNTESCTKYWGCPYIDFCTAWPNPLKRCEEPPPGYVIERWNPSEREALAKEVWHLDYKDKEDK